MPERMHFEFVPSDDDPLLGYIETNLQLAESDQPEYYASMAEADEGSFVAQVLAGIVGVRALSIEQSRVILWREEDADWESVVAQAIMALREEFL